MTPILRFVENNSEPFKRLFEFDRRTRQDLLTFSFELLETVLFSNTLIASKDRSNTLRVKRLKGGVYLERDGEIIFKRAVGFKEKVFGSFLDIAYIPKQKRRKIEGYFIFCEANLFEVPLNQEKPKLLEVFPKEISDEIRRKSKIYPQMKLAPTTDTLFMLFPHTNRSNYIQGVGLNSDTQAYLAYPKIPNNYEDISPHRIAWFDFIGQNPSLMLAITEDNHYCLIIYDYQEFDHSICNFHPLPDILGKNHTNIQVLSSGPYCLSSNGKFLLAKINRDFDVLYQVRLLEKEGEGYQDISLEYLDAKKKVHGQKERAFYHYFQDPFCGNTKLQAAFLAVDGPIFRVLGWSIETGSRLQTWGKGSLPVGQKSREDEGEIFSNICQAGEGHFYLCDQVGHLISVRIQSIGEN